jgi:hypothetical protein
LESTAVDNSKILFVGCPNLGPEALKIFGQILPGHKFHIWKRGCQTSKEAIKTSIMKGGKRILFSFYNDYLFDGEELDQFELAVNIHPSLERGRGYDTIPLMENHATHGIMLHYVTEQYDAGQIIRVTEQPIPAQIEYPAFRRANQLLCLEMMRQFAIQVAGCDNVGCLNEQLQTEANKLNRQWGDRYISANTLGRRLRELRETDPSHRVLVGQPEEIINYDSRKKQIA